MKSTSPTTYQSLTFRKLSEWIFLGLLIYMPLHVLFSTWIGTSLGTLTAAKIAKDVVLVVGFILAFIATDKTNIKKLLKDKLVWLIAAYTAITLLLAIIKPTEQDAEVLGVVYNLRFLIFLLYGALIMSWQASKKFITLALKAVLVTGGIVATFGIIQYFLLPDNALSHLGYSKESGTYAAYFIDDKPEFERVMSTIKDPNSLGAYMIIIISVAISLLGVAKQKTKKLLGALIGISLLCLWLTFSRGAVLSLVVALTTLTIVNPKSREVFKKYKRVILSIVVALLCIATVGGVLVKDSKFVQNVVFHADEETVLEDPNELRLRFWRESVSGIFSNPFGSGPGTAGIVSIRNQEQGVILNENYYLQVATEVGIVGLLIFLAILVTVVLRLWRLRDWPLARGMLASLAGLAFTSLLIHTWSNEAVAYTFWGLCSLIVFFTPDTAGILKKQRRENV